MTTTAQNPRARAYWLSQQMIYEKEQLSNPEGNSFYFLEWHWKDGYLRLHNPTERPALDRDAASKNLERSVIMAGLYLIQWLLEPEGMPDHLYASYTIYSIRDKK